MNVTEEKPVNRTNITSASTTLTTSQTPPTTTTVISTTQISTSTTQSIGTNADVDTVAVAIGASLGGVFLVVAVIVTVLLIRRRRQKKTKKGPPTLPPPYQPSLYTGSPPTNDGDSTLESQDAVVNSDSANPEQFISKHDNFIREGSVVSNASSYLEPQDWVKGQTGDKQTDEEFYICMEPDNNVISAVSNKKSLPHHELVYSDTGDKSIPSDSPKPCAGVSKAHGYVNVPSGASSDSPSSPNEDNSTPNYYNCERKSELPGYANLQQGTEVMERTTTLPKYSNIPMVKPNDIERYMPKSTPKSKQKVKDSKSKTGKAKQLKDDGKRAGAGSIDDINKKSSTQPSPHTRTEGHYVNNVVPPKTLPKPSKPNHKGSDGGGHPGKIHDEDDERDKDYVNVCTKLGKPQTHGCKEELTRVFQNKKLATR